MASITATEYNHSPGKARRLAADGNPVFITDHGAATHVVLTIAEYERLNGTHTAPRLTGLDSFRMDLADGTGIVVDDIEFERRTDRPRGVDLT